MIEAEELRKTNTAPIQRFREGDEVSGGLLVLEAVFNRVPWMWSYKVSDRDGCVMEMMEWSL
jgi:hypothetical protein